MGFLWNLGIYVTNQRLVEYNRFSKGLIGKPKEKNGKASAGYLYNGSISNLRTFYQRGVPVLLICCYRIDGTRIAITVKCSNLDTIEKTNYRSSGLYRKLDCQSRKKTE